MDGEPATVAEHGLLAVPDEIWSLAVRRAEVIGRLARSGVVGLEAADAAVAALGVSRRLVYVLLARRSAVSTVVRATGLRRTLE